MKNTSTLKYIHNYRITTRDRIIQNVKLYFCLSSDTSIKIWDVAIEQSTKALNGHTKRANSIAYISHNTNLVVMLIKKKK